MLGSFIQPTEMFGNVIVVVMCKFLALVVEFQCQKCLFDWSVKLDSFYKKFACLLEFVMMLVRCGALHIGDQVLSINDVALDSASVSEAMRQLHCDAGDQLVLEILPKVRSRVARLTSSSLSSNSSITCQFCHFVTYFITTLVAVILGCCYKHYGYWPGLAVTRASRSMYLLYVELG